MDAVITYVNSLDPVWRDEYSSVVGGKMLSKRYRDWGTLKYLLRGIERHIPFVGNVFLVVSGETQVPDWVDRSAVRIVLHKDIVPAHLQQHYNRDVPSQDSWPL